LRGQTTGKTGRHGKANEIIERFQGADRYNVYNCHNGFLVEIGWLDNWSKDSVILTTLEELQEAARVSAASVADGQVALEQRKISEIFVEVMNPYTVYNYVNRRFRC